MLSRNLRKLREARGWTQSELGRRSGLSGKVIWDIEEGRSKMPAYDRVMALAGALGVTGDELVGPAAGRRRKQRGSAAA